MSFRMATAADPGPIPPARHTTYRTSPDEFDVRQVDCPGCGGQMPVLTWRQPQEARDQGVNAPTAHVGHLAALFIRNAAGRACRRCTIRAHVGRLVRPAAIQGGGLHDPVRDMLAEFQRARSPQPTLGDEWPTGLFPLGRVAVTPMAKLLLGRSLDEDFADDRQRLEAGGPRALLGYLAAHASEATVPRLKAAEVKVARSLGPLGTVAQQNAAAVADGDGSVISRHAVHMVRHWRDVQELTVWTQLGPDPTTLVYTRGDEVSPD